VQKRFEQLSEIALEDRSLGSEYLMTINTSPDELNKRFGIDFVPTGDDAEKLYAAIKFENSDLIFQFECRGAETKVSIRGNGIDMREAYSVFTSAIELPSNEIVWISDSSEFAF